MNTQTKIQIKRFKALALLFFAVPFIQLADAADELHHREVNQKNPGGKDLVMTFQELKRDEKTSTVKVTMTSGTSVPSAMFIMRGFYDIALIRKVGYLIKLSEKEEGDGSWTYVVGFSKDKKVNIQEFFKLKKPLPEDDGFSFMAVKDLEPLFKGQK